MFARIAGALAALPFIPRKSEAFTDTRYLVPRIPQPGDPYPGMFIVRIKPQGKSMFAGEVECLVESLDGNLLGHFHGSEKSPVIATARNAGQFLIITYPIFHVNKEYQEVRTERKLIVARRVAA